MTLPVRVRLSFSFALIFAVILSLFSGVVYHLMSSNLERELKEDSEHDVEQVLHVFTEDMPWQSQLAEMSEESQEFRLLIRLINDQGRPLYLTEGITEWDWPLETKLIEQSRQGPVWSNADIKEVSHLILTRNFIPKGRPPHIIQVANSRADINRIRNRLVTCINIGTPLALFISIVIGYFFSKRVLIPVEQSVEKMKRFIADASHELRIPLTGLRGTLEVALRQDRSKKEYRQTVENAYDESERLSELVRGLLSLARADAGEFQIEKTSVDVEPFLRDVFEQGETLNAEKTVTLKLGPLAGGSVALDEIKIHQLLLNLIENAIRYNKPGGEVVLFSERKPGHVFISVRDTGIGISAQDQRKIFDRFYRVDKTRAREAGGTGLGLSIARSIAEAHGGALNVQSVLGQGSTFTLTLPA